MPIKESTHWYDKNGAPCYTQIAKNGNERPTNLRDARKLDLVPSVTSILGIMSKPGLELWKVQQAILASLTLPQGENEPLHDFAKRALEDSKEQAKAAAARGTEIHAAIEAGFRGETDLPNDGWLAYQTVLMGLEAEYPEATGKWIAEDSFATKFYGGKVDLYAHVDNKLIVVDFKTKENVSKTTASKLVYDEHGIQLAAYAEGLLDSKIEWDPGGDFTVERMSVFIDRDQTTKVQAYRWLPEEYERHAAMFRTMVVLWYLTKQFQNWEEFI